MVAYCVVLRAGRSLYQKPGLLDVMAEHCRRFFLMKHRPRTFRCLLCSLCGTVPRKLARFGYNPGMSTEAVAVGMVPDELKHEPRSKGLTTPRKKKPKELAVITECCTGCAGSPACVEYCPVEDCMFWVPDEDHPPFGRIQVDPILCIGCKKCISKGPDGCFLDGCPWDAIVMVDTAEVEKEVGVMAI
jgi:ferredoxin